MPLKAVAAGPHVTPGSIGALDGGVLAKAYPIASVLANQDRLLRSGRRIVARWGLNGCGVFLVPSVDGSSSMSQLYPQPTDARVQYRGRVTLTPGYQLRCSFLCIPSGATQSFGAAWAYDTPGGYVEVTAYLDNGSDTETVTRQMVPPVSKDTYYGEPSGAGEAWSALVSLECDLFPTGIYDDDSALKWCKGNTTVTLTVTYYGGIRGVDGVIWEHFTGYLRNWTDTEYVAHGYADGQGKPLKKYPSQYPIQRRQEATPDPTCGSKHALDVSVYQQIAIGPTVVAYSTWDDSVEAPADLTPRGITVSSATPVEIINSATAADEDESGWSSAACATARGFNLSGDLLELRDNDGVIPVKVHAYGACAASDGTLEIMGGTRSAVKVLISSATPGWFTSYGEIRCGVGPQSNTSIQAFAYSDSAADVDVYYISIEYDRGRRVG